MKKLFVFLLLSSLAYGSGEFRTPNGIISQGHVSVGTNNAADPSAVLDLQSTSQGVAFPRMTTTQLNAIPNPVAGLTVYNTTANALFTYQNGVWSPVGSGNLPAGLSALPPILYNGAGQFSCAVASSSQPGCISVSDYTRFGSAVTRVVLSTTANLTLTNPTSVTDYVVYVDSSSGAVTVTLPDAVAAVKGCVDLKNVGSPANLVTVATQLGQVQDGIPTLPSSGETKRLCAYNGNWSNF